MSWLLFAPDDDDRRDAIEDVLAFTDDIDDDVPPALSTRSLAVLILFALIVLIALLIVILLVR